MSEPGAFHNPCSNHFRIGAPVKIAILAGHKSNYPHSSKDAKPNSGEEEESGFLHRGSFPSRNNVEDRGGSHSSNRIFLKFAYDSALSFLRAELRLKNCYDKICVNATSRLPGTRCWATALLRLKFSQGMVRLRRVQGIGGKCRDAGDCIIW